MPTLPQRLIHAVKSYIYTPEEGKYDILVSWWSAHVFYKLFVTILFLFLHSFPFPIEVGYIWCSVVYNPVSGN